IDPADRPICLQHAEPNVSRLVKSEAVGGWRIHEVRQFLCLVVELSYRTSRSPDVSVGVHARCMLAGTLTRHVPRVLKFSNLPSLGIELRDPVERKFGKPDRAIRRRDRGVNAR